MITAAQEVSKESTAVKPEKLEYGEIVDVPGATKDQLFRTARKWFQKNYSEKAVGENVIYTDDSYLGEMAASPYIWVEARVQGKPTGAGSVNYNIIIAAKEGKYKYSLSGFYHESNRSQFGSGGDMNNAVPDCGEELTSLAAWAEIKADCKAKAEKIVQELKETMSSAATNSEEDW
jgi:hypothetical protein